MHTQSVVIQRRPSLVKGLFVILRGRGAHKGITHEGVIKFFRRGGFVIETPSGEQITKYQADSFDVTPVNKASADFMRERHANS